MPNVDENENTPNDKNMKIYRPKNKSSAPANNAVSTLERNTEEGVAEMDGGVMLTKAEILDFAEGADSKS